MTDRPTAAADAPDPDRIAQSELDRLALAVTDRFAPHLSAAAAAVREAEQDLAEARASLARAEQAAATMRYVSDPLVFMRVTVREELDGLSRKTTPKKARASFRHLLARAAELAEGELQGHRKDLESARRERDQGVEACRQAERTALDDLEAARAMQQRVLEAERAARDGLLVLGEKMQPDPT
jgi:flagellar motility protein MotE (MotC chaperone)